MLSLPGILDASPGDLVSAVTIWSSWKDKKSFIIPLDQSSELDKWLEISSWYVKSEMQGKWKQTFSIFILCTSPCPRWLGLFTGALRNSGKFYFPHQDSTFCLLLISLYMLSLDHPTSSCFFNCYLYARTFKYPTTVQTSICECSNPTCSKWNSSPCPQTLVSSTSVGSSTICVILAAALIIGITFPYTEDFPRYELRPPRVRVRTICRPPS